MPLFAKISQPRFKLYGDFSQGSRAKGDEFLPNLPVTIDVDVSTAPLKDLYDGVEAGATVEKAGT